MNDREKALFSRREFGKLALATVPAVALYDTNLLGAALVQAKPNSMFGGVQIGTITYSYRSMPDQSAEATLRYILESGISAVELMGGPVESFAGAPSGRGGGGGRGAAGGGAAGAGAAAAGAPAGAPLVAGRGGGGGGRGQVDPATLTASWNGTPCAPGREGGAPAGGGGGRAAGAPGAPPAAAAGAAVAPPAGGGGGGRGGNQTPEQIAQQQEAQNALKTWRTSVSMDKFKALRKMYNDAGVTIYAWKQLSTNMTDEEYEYIFNVAEALGCSHTTLELPTDEAALKRVGDFAMKKKIYAAYHTHLQGSMTCFDRAFALSKGNMANVDLGHWVAGGNVGGTPMDFLTKYHDRTASFHIKDRTSPKNCALNLAWGTGETPLKEILQLVKKNKWKIPASIELEYNVPEGSDAVKEVKKCVEYCKAALA